MSLHASLRSNNLLHYLGLPLENEDQELVLRLPEVDSHYEGPASTLHIILHRVLRLEASILPEELESGNSGAEEYVIFLSAKQADNLCRQLDDWKKTQSWENLQTSPPSEPRAQTSSTLQAILLAQWQCTYLSALRLRLASNSLTAAIWDTSSTAGSNVMLAEAQATTDMLLNTIIPALASRRAMARMSSGMANININASRISPRAELVDLSIDEYAVSPTLYVARYHLLKILAWTLVTLAEPMKGAEAFQIDSRIWNRLREVQQAIETEHMEESGAEPVIARRYQEE